MACQGAKWLIQRSHRRCRPIAHSKGARPDYSSIASRPGLTISINALLTYLIAYAPTACCALFSLAIRTGPPVARVVPSQHGVLHSCDEPIYRSRKEGDEGWQKGRWIAGQKRIDDLRPRQNLHVRRNAMRSALRETHERSLASLF